MTASAARFLAALEALWPEGIRSGRTARLGLAVSGGPDSLALLLLAAKALPGRIDVATVDHGLRAESPDEAALVARSCSEMDAPHETLSVVVAEGNIQSQARAARYAALGEWAARRGLGAIATAHHADDQAETLLLRLNRASGVAGLAGARARGTVPGIAVPVIRPLLDWRRAELGELVAASGMEPVQDPSNSDDRFDRARIRKALAKADWLDCAALAASAGHLAEADAALAWAAEREWRECVMREGLGMTYRPRAPRAVALRVLSRIVEEAGGSMPRGSAIAQLFEALLRGQPASIGSLVARPMNGAWSFMAAPARKAGGQKVRAPS